ncbi:MAG: hypothetical protein A2Y07_11505 [Planctomycetes bacterium GWF2_50_10]|nr:MAG: hypothetical protein A2Y07_11505 [Planctomycetes bacterium GWF2_50_10]
MFEFGLLAWGMPGGWEWIIILVIALLIFGSRLPALAKGMGKSLSEFKKGIKEGTGESRQESEDRRQ